MDLYRKNKVLWTMALAAEEFYNVLRFFAGIVLSDPVRNCEHTVGAMIMLGQLHETVKPGFENLLSDRREQIRPAKPGCLTN